MDDNKRNHIKTFNCHGYQATLDSQWKRWLIVFELFADGNSLIINEENANSRQRRCALLLHLVGTDVQDIFYTLLNIGDGKDYKKAMDALNTYFVPKLNTLGTASDSLHKHLGRQFISLQPDSGRQ